MKLTSLTSAIALALAISPVLAYAGSPQLSTSSGLHFSVGQKLAVKAPLAQNATSTTYKFDDHTSENAVGFGNGVSNIPAIWFDNFVTVKGGEKITSIEVSYGTPTNSTTAGQLNLSLEVLAIWSDPNNDGNPADAVLLAKTRGLIHKSNTNTFVTYTFKTPVVIGKAGTSFFAGNITPAVTTSEYFFEALDTTASAGHSWVAAQANGGKLNVKHPGRNDTVGTIDSFGLPGNWLIRTIGVK